ASETNLAHVPPGLFGVDTARFRPAQGPTGHGPVRVDRLDMPRDALCDERLAEPTGPVVHRGLDRLSSDDLSDGGGGEDARTRFKPLIAALLELVVDG